MTCETKQCPTHGEVFPIMGMCPWGCNYRFEKRKKINKSNIKYKPCEINEDTKLYSCNEAALIINANAKSLRKWANQGVVPHVIESGFIRFTEDDINRIKQAMES